jgi:hypothetical protein
LLNEERFTTTKVDELEDVISLPVDGPNVLSRSIFVERTLLVSRRKGPRHYVNAGLLFGLTDQFDLDFTYAFGELAPTFQKVNKFQAGFGYRFNFRR